MAARRPARRGAGGQRPPAGRARRGQRLRRRQHGARTAGLRRRLLGPGAGDERRSCGPGSGGGRRPAQLPGRVPARLGRGRPSRTCCDLSSTADALDGGAWLRPGIEDVLARQALDAGAHAVVTAFGAARLTRSAPLSAEPPANVATGVDVWWDRGGDPAGALGRRGHRRRTAAARCRSGPGDRRRARRRWPARRPLFVRGTRCSPCRPGARVRITVRLAGERRRPGGRDGGPAARLAEPRWWTRARCSGCPARPPADDPGDLLARRAASFADVQEHYYADPPRIERGWREHLVDTDGRGYLDMVNNVAVLGHGHPGVADAVHRQLRRLNTNSRFHYAAVVGVLRAARGAAARPAGHRLPGQLRLRGRGPGAAPGAWPPPAGGTSSPSREAYHGWTYADRRRLHLDGRQPERPGHPARLGAHRATRPTATAGRHRGDDARTGTRPRPSRPDRRARRGRGARPPRSSARPFYGNAGGHRCCPTATSPRCTTRCAPHGGPGHRRRGAGRLRPARRVVLGLRAAGRRARTSSRWPRRWATGTRSGAVITTPRDRRRPTARQGYFFSSAGGSPVSQRGRADRARRDRRRGAAGATPRTVGEHLRRAAAASSPSGTR